MKLTRRVWRSLYSSIPTEQYKIQTTPFYIEMIAFLLLNFERLVSFHWFHFIVSGDEAK